MHHYPDQSALQQALASRYEISPKRVLITAGADEAIDRVCRAFLPGEDAELLTIRPTFEMIAHYSRLSNATIRSVYWLGSEFPLTEIISFHSKRTRLMVLVSPNNPTGAAIPMDAIVKLATQFENTPILVDLAYVEFSSQDPTRVLLQFDNIILVRTFSKAYGLPGIRIGYALGNPEFLRAMLTAGGPYSVTSHSLSVALNALNTNDSSLQTYVLAIQSERESFCKLLSELNIDSIRSEANFVLIRTPEGALFDCRMKEFGIQTRAFPLDAELVNMRRITLPGNRTAFDKLQQAITAAFTISSI
jgi:histidinol-phosphate aminotransferase